MRLVIVLSFVCALAMGCDPASSASKTEIKVRAPGVNVDIEKKKD